MDETGLARAGDGIDSIDIDRMLFSEHRHAFRVIVEITSPRV
jgi:hypothetical protein